MGEKVYEYENVRLIRVIDGDTVELDIDMGNRIWWRGVFRLTGIDAPETKGKTRPEGETAKAYLAKLLEDEISLARTAKPDKYGRWLVQLWTAEHSESINALMVLRGHAAPYDGGVKP